MQKLLFVGNPTILGENIENILKSNYDTDLFPSGQSKLATYALALIML
mgnify:CR=1 FL=1